MSISPNDDGRLHVPVVVAMLLPGLPPTVPANIQLVALKVIAQKMKNPACVSIDAVLVMLVLVDACDVLSQTVMRGHPLAVSVPLWIEMLNRVAAAPVPLELRMTMT